MADTRRRSWRVEWHEWELSRKGDPVYGLLYRDVEPLSRKMLERDGCGKGHVDEEFIPTVGQIAVGIPVWGADRLAKKRVRRRLRRELDRLIRETT